MRTAAFLGLEESVEAAQTLLMAEIGGGFFELGTQLEYTSSSLGNSISEAKSKIDALNKKLGAMEKNAVDRQKNTDTKIDKFWENHKE